MKNKYLSLVIILLVTFIAPMIGSYATATFKEPWYSEIVLPTFNPPSWVFAPVWTTLYLLMSIAIWKIWKNSFNTRILKIYFIHLFFNSTWSIVFFGFHLIGLALVNLIIILWSMKKNKNLFVPQIFARVDPNIHKPNILKNKWASFPCMNM